MMFILLYYEIVQYVIRNKYEDPMTNDTENEQRTHDTHEASISGSLPRTHTHARTRTHTY